MLSGEKYKVEHGYFVVKNPGQSSLDQGIDHVQARAEETEFFEGNEPWRSELSQFSEHFGTTRLQTVLSRKLTQQIMTRYVEHSVSINRELTLYLYKPTAYMRASSSEGRINRNRAGSAS